MVIECCEVLCWGLGKSRRTGSSGGFMMDVYSGLACLPCLLCIDVCGKNDYVRGRLVIGVFCWGIGVYVTILH